MRAHVRIASTLSSPYLCKIVLLQQHFIFGPSNSYLLGVYQHYTTVARDGAVLRARRLHTSTALRFSARVRLQDSKFLRPRGKPKFRVRTAREDEELLDALQIAQEEEKHKVLRALESGRNQSRPNGQSILLSRPLDVDTDGLRSPFFADPSTDLAASLHDHDTQFDSESKQQDFLPRRTMSRRSRLPRLQTSTADLEYELHYIAHHNPHPTAIHRILKILIHDRKIRPSSQHYEALVLANTWPEYGSVINVEKVITEMQMERVEIGANIVAAVLKVLAIHPSPALSHRMLSIAERQWIQLSSQTYHHLVLAMIRSGQLELAVLTLDLLRQNSKSTRSWDREIIPDYLVVLLLAEMVNIGDWEGVLRYFYKLRNRRAADREISNEFWAWLLEQASRAAEEVSESSSFKVESVVNKVCNLPLQSASAELDSHPKLLDDHQPSDTVPVPTSRARYIQTQASLSNPAFHLVTAIWSFYVASQSLHPSHTTLLCILRSAANTGTVWLAHGVVAVMTYMNGINKNGRPESRIASTLKTDGNDDDEVKLLVEKAGRRAAEIARQDLANERGDVEDARKRKEAEAREESRKSQEVEEWWTQLLNTYPPEEEAEGGGADRTVNNNNSSSSSSGSEIGNQNEFVKAPSLPRGAGGRRHGRRELDTKTRSDADGDTDGKDRMKDLNGSREDRFYSDLETAPPGNLWPFFPTVDGMDSALVDPWDALGPRSSSRRKWTEAQRHFKQAEMAKRKRY